MDFSELWAILGSGAFVGFVQFLINRHDKRHDSTKEINEKVDKNYKVSTERYETHEKSIAEIYKQINHLNDKNDLILQFIVGMGHDRLVSLTDKISKRKAITLKEQATLKAIYVPYHKAGGNGDGEVGFNYCMELPVVTDAEADEMDKKIKRRLYGIDIDDKKEDKSDETAK